MCRNLWSLHVVVRYRDSQMTGQYTKEISFEEKEENGEMGGERKALEGERAECKGERWKCREILGGFPGLEKAGLKVQREGGGGKSG